MQASTPPRASGDPFADLFNPAFAQPTPPLPTIAGHDSNLPGGHGLGGLVNGLFETLFGGSSGGGTGGPGGVGMLGDFDPFQYVESNLARSQKGGGLSSSGGSGGGGLDIGQVIGSLASLVGG